MFSRFRTSLGAPRSLVAIIDQLESRTLLSGPSAESSGLIVVVADEYEEVVHEKYGGELNVDVVYDDDGNTQEVDVVTDEHLIQAKRLTERSFDNWPEDRLPGDTKRQLERTKQAADREGKDVIFVAPVPIPEPYKTIIEDMGIETDVVPMPDTAIGYIAPTESRASVLVGGDLAPVVGTAPLVGRAIDRVLPGLSGPNPPRDRIVSSDDGEGSEPIDLRPAQAVESETGAFIFAMRRPSANLLATMPRIALREIGR